MQDEARAIDRVLDWSPAARLGALATLALLPAGLVLALVIWPRWTALAENRGILARARADLAAAEGRMIEDRELARRSPIRQRFAERFLAWLPPDERLPEVLSTAALAAREAGVRDLTFARVPSSSPSDPGAQPTNAPGTIALTPAGVIESQVQLEARASLPGIGAFIDTLLASPRYLRIEKLRVVPLLPEREARLASADRARLALILRLTALSGRVGGS